MKTITIDTPYNKLDCLRLYAAKIIKSAPDGVLGEKVKILGSHHLLTMDDIEGAVSLHTLKQVEKDYFWEIAKKSALAVVGNGSVWHVSKPVTVNVNNNPFWTYRFHPFK